jgi:hypothetical protein
VSGLELAETTAGLWLINVIAASEQDVPVVSWPFLTEPAILPVALESHRLVHLHEVDDPVPIRLWRQSNDPILGLHSPPDVGFAAGERAITEKWVWGETCVMFDNVGVKPHISPDPGSACARNGEFVHKNSIPRGLSAPTVDGPESTCIPQIDDRPPMPQSGVTP